MRVLFVIAPFSLAKSVGLNRMTRRGNMKPLGVGYMAAVLQQAGHEASLLDALSLRWGIEETVRAIAEKKPGLIGVSCYTFGRMAAYALVRRIKEILPDTPVVLGGPHPVTFGEGVAAECPETDYIIVGEAEFAMTELANRLASGQGAEGVPGLIGRGKNGSWYNGGPPKTERNLDALPFPARHIYDEDLYDPRSLFISVPRMAAETILTSRGCSYGKCGFCYSGEAYAARYRRRSPENAMQELRQLHRDRGIRFVFFLDDNFCVNYPWIERFCDLLDHESFRISWFVFGRVDTVTLEMLKRMSASGCRHIFFGVESGNQETLDMINKGVKLDMVRSAVRWAQQSGIEVKASFILGLPRETPEMSRNTVRFACELNPDYAAFIPYHVWPGTALESIALHEGQLLSHDNENLILPSYLPNTYQNAEQLDAMVRYAYRAFYRRPRFIFRALWQARKPHIFLDHAEKALMAFELITFRQMRKSRKVSS